MGRRKKAYKFFKSLLDSNTSSKNSFNGNKVVNKDIPSILEQNKINRIYFLLDKTINVPHDIVIKAINEDAVAQLDLGKIYFNSSSVENNLDEAFKWVLLSAERGNMEAQFKLGNIYALGCGTKKSFPDAYKWYTKAAVQGYKKALIRIHNLYQEDIRMRCRGQLNSEEEEWVSDKYKKENNIRELYEYRLEQNKSILDGAIEYFTSKFNHYQSSDQEDQYVQLNLAFLYQHGYGVKKCSRWAFEYYELAADQGNVDAQYNLGYLYQRHTSKKFNYRHAFKWYSKSAQGGNVAAQRCLAYFYLKGLATDIDYETAIIWYKKSAIAGDAEAQVTLGKLYRKGDYIKQNFLTAVKWYTLAARQGSRVAQTCLSQLHQRGMLADIQVEDDISEYLIDSSMNERLCSKLSMDISKLCGSSNFNQLNKLAKRACIGDGPAMFEIGLHYYHGDKCFKQDKDAGIKWIKNAANAKYKDAQIMLADLYRKGDSIEQDYHRAAIWYRKIAKEKDVQAQCNVGVMYNEGLGVRKNPLEASKWFIWAADQHNSDAQYNLGMLRYEGRGVRKDNAETVEWLYESVCQGNIRACYQLGYFYFNGLIGLEKNMKNAFELLFFAAKKGHTDAQVYLGAKLQYFDYRSKEKARSIKYYTMEANSDNGKALFERAITCLNRASIDHDYIKAYYMFKEAKDMGYEDANFFFQVPIKPGPYTQDNSRAIRMLTKVTEKGIDDLSYYIGCLYLYGVKKNYQTQLFKEKYIKAEEWFLVASKKGDLRADYRLGIMYENGRGVEKNLVTAAYYYNKAIKNDNNDAMYRLACIYLEGYPVQDLLEAFNLFTIASTIGYRKATDVLMVFQKDIKTDSDSIILLEEDPEIPVNRENRIRMLEKATEEGYTRLQYQLGLMYEHNSEYSKAFKWLSLAADFGITDAYYRIGVFYEEGKGTKQNYSKAANMYQKASKKDHEDACYRLGRLYQHGNGVQLDYIKAYNLYKMADEMGHYTATMILNIGLKTRVQVNGNVEKHSFHVTSKEYQDSLIMYKYVAEHGNTEAQFKVGFAYEYSFPEANHAEAFKWYSMAANNSHREAMYHLGLLYEYGLGISQDYDKAIQRYNQAYQLGSDDALFRLAIIYHHGNGVDIDPEKAIKYYILSAELGNPEYQCELGRLYEEGELIQRNLLDALKWYTIAYAQGYDIIRPKLLAMYDDKKPYERFFYEKLVRNLTVASCNYFGLNSDYTFKEFGKVNNRLGMLHLFGLGTSKSFKQFLRYFSLQYSNIVIGAIEVFDFLEYDDFSDSQKLAMLKEVEADEEHIEQLEPEHLYRLGMIYYHGLVKTQSIREYDGMKVYISVDEQDPDDPSQYVVIEKNHLKAFKYLKKAADEKYYEAMSKPVLFIHNSDGKGGDVQGDQYSGSERSSSNTVVDSTGTLLHPVKSFSKTIEWYNYLEKVLTEDKVIPKSYRKRINGLVKIGWGYLYEYGYGVKQDYKKAMEHYKMLADEKYVMGYFRLALMHYYGKGVSVDYKEALELFEKVEFKTLFYDQVLFIYIQNDFRLNYSPRKVQGERFYYLGLIHKYGQGVPKDIGKARSYFKSALEFGCERAENEL